MRVAPGRLAELSWGMSYQSVSALRSTRFPLMGLGCGCSDGHSSASGLGLEIGSLVAGGGAVGIGMTGLVIGYFLGKHAQRRGLALNRGRRNRRRGRR